MYALNPILALCACCGTASAKQTFLSVESAESTLRRLDASSDAQNTDTDNSRPTLSRVDVISDAQNTDNGDSRGLRADPSEDPTVQGAETETNESTEGNESAEADAFVEPPARPPAPKTWAELTPQERKAFQQRYVAGQYFQAFALWVIWTVLGVLTGLFIYTQAKTEQDDKVDPAGEGGPRFEFNNYCGCLEDMSSCACACLCPALRWADTLSQAGLSKFWLAFLLYTVLGLLNCLHWGKMWAGIFTAIGVCVFRQRLRAKIGLPAWEVQGCLLDCCFSLWCPCCAIAQDARVVQAMQRCGHESLEQGDDGQA